MASRSLYQGDGIALVDDKGRVAIPPTLRQQLAANAPKADGKTGGTVIIGAHQSHQCLIAYDQGYLDLLAARLEKQESEHEAATGAPDFNILRSGASGEPVPFDGSGRFIMPEFPRFHANIGTHAFFYGTLRYIEIWDPQTLINSPDVPADHVMKKMARFYMAKRGVTL